MTKRRLCIENIATRANPVAVPDGVRAARLIAGRSVGWCCPAAAPGVSLMSAWRRRCANTEGQGLAPRLVTPEEMFLACE
jgi:hypothetical protein